MAINPDDLQELADDAFRNKESATALILRVREDPVTALQLLSSTSLARGQEAKALDNIIGAIGDDEKAIELVAEHVTVDLQTEILTAWGDRVSALAQIVDPETLVAAILEISSDAGQVDVAVACATIRGLAIQISDRSDWSEVLAHELQNDYTLRDLLIITVAAEVESVDEDPSDDDDDDQVDKVSSRKRPPDAWVNVGLDPDEAEERLQELGAMNVDLFNEVTDSKLFLARRSLSKKREHLGLPAASTRGSATDV